MTTTAQYASVAKSGVAQVTVANPNRDGTGAVVNVATGSANSSAGSRLDSLLAQATVTTTAGMLRFYMRRGRPGGAITSTTFTGTTAVVTTATPHGLTTGNLATVQSAYPDEYNVTDAALTVTGPNTFTYVMSVAPTTNAVLMGSYSTVVAVPTMRLIAEVPVPANVVSATNPGSQLVISSQNSAYRGVMPMIIPPGWSLMASSEKAEAINLVPVFMGDFA